MGSEYRLDSEEDMEYGSDIQRKDSTVQDIVVDTEGHHCDSTTENAAIDFCYEYLDLEADQCNFLMHRSTSWANSTRRAGIHRMFDGLISHQIGP